MKQRESLAGWLGEPNLFARLARNENENAPQASTSRWSRIRIQSRIQAARNVGIESERSSRQQTTTTTTTVETSGLEVIVAVVVRER